MKCCLFLLNAVLKLFGYVLIERWLYEEWNTVAHQQWERCESNLYYEELLKKYMRHVVELEGLTFLREVERQDAIFTPEEWAALQAMEANLFEVEENV